MARDRVRQGAALMKQTPIRKRVCVRFSAIIVSSIMLAFAPPALAQTESDPAAAANLSDAQLQSGCDNDGNRMMCALYAQRVGKSTANVKGDINRSAEYFSKGCELGGGPSCYMYGRMRRAGVGGAATEDEVLKIFEKACQTVVGSADGCIEAGIILTKQLESEGAGAPKGMGPPLKALEAKKYFVSSCDLKSMNGCYYAGQITYKLGNAREALPYLEKACSNNFKDSCALRAEVNAKLENYDAERGKPKSEDLAGTRGSPPQATPAKLSGSLSQRNACSVAYGAANALWEQGGLPSDGATANQTFASRQFVVLGLDHRRDAYPDDLFMLSLKRVQDLRTNPVGENAVLLEVTQCDALFGYEAIEIQ
jgi:hypothetical protein